MSLNITRGKKPSDSFLRDANAFRGISPDKLPHILEFASTYVVERRPIYSKLIEELAKKTETTDVTVIAAINVISLIARKAPTVTKEELIDDLRKLEFNNEAIDQIRNFLETIKTKLYDFAERTRNEAVPRLVDINWRIDIRHASGDFLKEPTVYALMRIQGYDGEKMKQVYLELDRDDLSWLEATVSKMKAKFIEAEKMKEKMYPREQS